MLFPTPWTRVLALAWILVTAAQSQAGDEASKAAGQKPAGAKDESRPTADSPAKPASAAPDASPAGKGTVVADFDNDGWADLYVANLYQSGPKQPQALSEYWIGIDGIAPDEALRAQLEIPPGQGLLVNQVVEESPAARAGLKPYDVLLACQDKPLVEIGDLAKIIEEQKEALLSLRLIRGGKRIIIEITPQKRPASQTGETCPAVSKADDATFLRRVWLDLLGHLPESDEIQKFSAEKQEKKREVLVNRLLRKSTVAIKSCTACHANDGQAVDRILTPLVWDTEVLKFQHGGANSYIKRLVGLPGALINLNDHIYVEAGQKLPDDVSLTVTFKGSEPAKITIKRGDQTWEASSADDRTKMPADLGGLVASVFARIQAPAAPTFTPAYVDLDGDVNLDGGVLLNGRVGWKARFGSDRHDVLVPSTTNPNPKPAAPESTFEKLDKQLESLGSQLGELRKAMHDLQQTLKTEKGKPSVEEKKAEEKK
jgi:hypothetical protein